MHIPNCQCEKCFRPMAWEISEITDRSIVPKEAVSLAPQYTLMDLEPPYKPKKKNVPQKIEWNKSFSFWASVYMAYRIKYLHFGAVLSHNERVDNILFYAEKRMYELH